MLKEKIIGYLGNAIYGLIIIIPFAMAIAPAPTNTFMGFLIAAFVAKKILKKERLFTRTAIDVPLMLFFLITCLSVVHSVNLKDSLRGGIARLVNFIFVFFILAEEVKDKKHIWKIIFSVSAGLLLASIDAIWQVATGKDFIRGYATIINIGLARATASFSDANTLGTYLSAIAPLVIGLALYYLKGAKRIIFGLISLLAITGVALTYSRPTLLAIYVILFFFGIVKKDKTLIIFLVIFTLLLPFLAPKSVKQWAKDVEYNPFRFMCNDDRIAIYQYSLRMIKDHPVIGLGVNTYMKNYKKYKDLGPGYRNVGTSDYLYAHNNFLQMAAEIGLMGLAVFFWLLYKLFKQCRRIYQGIDDHFLKIVSLSLSACLIAFLVNGLTESSLYSSRVAMIFWYLAGFSLLMNKFTSYANRR